MKNLCLTIFIFFAYNLLSQFSGNYTGVVNGDNVELTLQQNGNLITGKMKDSRQTYQVDGNVVANRLEAKAVEPSLGITIFLTGELSANNLQLKGELDIFGVKTPAFNTQLVKTNLNSTPSSTRQKNKISLLNGKSIDPSLIGQWRQESHYSSGYGSDFSGSTYTYTSFNSDHTMSENGSKATMSGSNYSGQSGGQSSGNVIPNIWYYTEGNVIMVIINNNGSYLTEKMGTYYIENGKLLFTQANTMKKILYFKE